MREFTLKSTDVSFWTHSLHSV